MPVRDDLVELLPRPSGRCLTAQVVQHEQGRLLHPVECFVVGDAAVGAEGVSEVVEQVGDGGKEDLLAEPEARVGHRDSQVGLAGARFAHKDEPSLGGARKVRGHGDGRLERFAAVAIGAGRRGVESLEGHVLEHLRLDAADAPPGPARAPAEVQDARRPWVQQPALDAAVQAFDLRAAGDNGG